MYPPTFLVTIVMASSVFSSESAEIKRTLANLNQEASTVTALRGGLQEEDAAVLLSDDADASVSGEENGAESHRMSYTGVSLHGHQHINGDDKNDEEKDDDKDDDEKDAKNDEDKDEEKSDSKKGKGKKDKDKEDEEDSKKGRKGKGGGKNDEEDEDSKNETKDGEDEDEDEEDKEAEELEKKLRLAKRNRRELRAELKSYKDDNGFAKKLSEDVETIANETQSYALARFLGSLKASQRQFAKANYEEFLEEEIEKADKKIKKLSKKLDKADDDDDADDKEKGKKKDDDDEKKQKKRWDYQSIKAQAKPSQLPSSRMSQ